MLTPAELSQLESTLLPALERHHLRLLAHALRTLQAISGRHGGPAPAPAAIEAWLEQQPELSADAGFRAAFATQLAAAARQLEAIAAPDRQPLDLALSDLLAWGRSAADARLGQGQG